jgi:cytochrome c-type biogenesis protein CcmH/NrfF
MSGARAPALAILAATLVGVAGLAAAASGAAGASGTSGAVLLPAIERQVMCVTCKIPLNVAISPQAERERAFIRELIAQGRDEAQIKRALVSQYGESVLGLPRAHGFDLAVYLVPVAVIAALLGLIAMLLPRWRRRTGQAGPRAPTPQLSSSDSARLEADMEHFD